MGVDRVDPRFYVRNRAIICDVLSHVGLIHHVDFRVNAYQDLGGLIPRGSVASIYGDEAAQVVANHADAIEADAVSRGGHGIHVSVRYPFLRRPEVPVVEVADFGNRVRELPAGRPAGRPKLSATVQTVRQFPRGTRVLAVDEYGITSRATVNGLDVEVFASRDAEDPDLPVEYRTRIGITWDVTARNRGRKNRRACAFTDQLMPLDQAFRAPAWTGLFVGARFDRDGVSFQGGFPQAYPVTATVVLADYRADRVTFDVDNRQASSRSPKRFTLSLDDFRAAWVISHDTA